MIQATEANKTTVLKIMDELRGRLASLYERWLCESEYEDINDYATNIKENLPEGVVFTKMTKKPFGFTFVVEGGSTFRMTINSRQIAIKQVEESKR